MSTFVRVLTLAVVCVAGTLAFAQDVERIEVTPSFASLPAGGDLQFTAEAYDSSGVVLPGLTFTWSTDVGSIDSSGLFIAQDSPQTGGYVRAAYAPVTGGAEIEVAAASEGTHTIIAETDGETVYPEWTSHFHGVASGFDRSKFVAVDADGNVYVTGWSQGEGFPDDYYPWDPWFWYEQDSIHYYDDYATVKYDSNGNELWVARYNGPEQEGDGAVAVTVDGSGNVYVTGASYGGSSYYGGTGWDYATIKYDSDGNQLWVARYDNGSGGHDQATVIAVDVAGNVYVTGTGQGDAGWYGDYTTIKYDTDGNQLWVARYDGGIERSDGALAMTVDESGNVYVTGRSWGDGTRSDYATIKYDANGTQLWAARYDSGIASSDEGRDIAVDSLGNVHVTGASYGGSSYSGGTGWDYATIKYDSDGNQLWAVRYDGPESSTDEAQAVVVDSDGATYVTGASYGGSPYAAGTGYDYTTIKYDTDGNELWVMRYDGPVSRDDGALAMAMNQSGNVIVAGYSVTELHGWDSYLWDYVTITYDSEGTQLVNESYFGGVNAWYSGIDRKAVAIAVGPANQVNVTFACQPAAAADECCTPYWYEDYEYSYDYVTIQYTSDGTTQWTARYDNVVQERTSSTALALDAQSNLYVTGTIGPYRRTDFLTTAYDPNGNELWSALYDGPAHGNDWVSDIATGPDGSVVVCGCSEDEDGGRAYTTVKYDSNGNELWAMQYDTTESYACAKLVEVDANGNVYVAGDVGSACTTVKYNSQGIQLWSASYNNERADRCRDMAIDSLGNVYVTGWSYDAVSWWDYATVKYDSDGNQLWAARYNGLDNSQDGANAIAVDSDGNVYVTGQARIGGARVVTVKYDRNGQEVWARPYIGPGTGVGGASAIALDSLGNVLLTGWWRTASEQTFLTVKYDPLGFEVWSTLYGDGRPYGPFASALAVDSYGDVYVLGRSRSWSQGVYGRYDFTTVKYRADGEQVWVARYDGPGHSYDYPADLAVDPDGNVYVTGNIAGGHIATIKYRGERAGTSTETQASEDALTEDITVKTGQLTGAQVTGDFTATLDLTDFTLLTITTGPFAGKGFSTGSWAATIEGTAYTGDWKGMAIFRPEEARIDLYGSLSGSPGISGTVEGALSESVPGSGVYDSYSATWKFGRMVYAVVSATVFLNGVVTYDSEVLFPDTELYLLQSNMEGTIAGDYSGSINAVITHLGIIEPGNPHLGEGFSIISYVSDAGTGEAWTYDTTGSLQLDGLSTGALAGQLSATIDETPLGRTLESRVSRVDLGSRLAANVEVVVVGPGDRISPGEQVQYVAIYENRGQAPAINLELAFELDPIVEYLSASSGATYDPVTRRVSWDLGELPAQEWGRVTVEVEVPWGLPDGMSLCHEVLVSPNIRTASPKRNMFANGICPDLDLTATFADATHSERIGLLFVAEDPDTHEDFDCWGDAQDVQRATPLYKRIHDYDGETPLVWDPTLVPPGPVPADVYLDGFQGVIRTTDQDCLTAPDTCRAMYFTPTDNNGLTYLQNLSDPRVSTLYAYSGGTRTALTAVLAGVAEAQPVQTGYVQCDRLVLVSPIKGVRPLQPYDWRSEVEWLRNYYPPEMMEIVVYQSASDSLTGLDVDWIDEQVQEKFDGGDIEWLHRNDINIKVNPGTAEFGWHDELRIEDLRIEIDQQEINQQQHTELDDYIYNSLVKTLPVCSDIAVARDPNVKYGPEGSVLPGQTLEYRVEYENEGEGIAFGVYFTDRLDENLDESTLVIGPVRSTVDDSIIAGPGVYGAGTRTITWFVGEVGPGQGGYADISVDVRDDAPDCAEIINFGTVYFPSVPEVTRTNAIVSIVNCDSDGDGLIDHEDNCPYAANADQNDMDEDGIGDPCDHDADGDGYIADSIGGDDCNDTDPLVNPGTAEQTATAYMGDFVVPVDDYETHPPTADVTLSASVSAATVPAGWEVKFEIVGQDGAVVTTAFGTLDEGGTVQVVATDVPLGVYSVEADFRGDGCYYQGSQDYATIVVSVPCFGVNGLKVGTKDARCEGIELLVVSSWDAINETELVGMYGPEEGQEKLAENTIVHDGVNDPVTIHTSCSQPIEIGDVFGAYTVTDLVEVFDDDPDSRGNDVEIRGSFDPVVLFDLAVDDVTYMVDDGNGHAFVLVIPAGSFELHGNPEKQKFKFDGTVDGMEIKAKFEKCKFKLKVKGVTNTNQLLGTTMTIRLQAGVNVGQEAVVMEDKNNHLKYKKEPKLKCCPECEGIALMQVTSDQGVLVFEPEPGHDKLPSNTVVDDGVNGPVTIHTSCSQPIDVGDVFGPYTISELIKIVEEDDDGDDEH